MAEEWKGRPNLFGDGRVRPILFFRLRELSARNQGREMLLGLLASIILHLHAGVHAYFSRDMIATC